MRRMIPQNQQEVLKKLSEKTQFLQGVTISGDVNGGFFVFDSDGISYFTISGSATTATTGEEYIEITGIPAGLSAAEQYPATNNLGTSEFVTTIQRSGNVWRIAFNAGTAGRTVYFSVMLSKNFVEL